MYFCLCRDSRWPFWYLPYLNKLFQNSGVCCLHKFTEFIVNPLIVYNHFRYLQDHRLVPAIKLLPHMDFTSHGFLRPGDSTVSHSSNFKKRETERERERKQLLLFSSSKIQLSSVEAFWNLKVKRQKEMWSTVKKEKDSWFPFLK